MSYQQVSEILDRIRGIHRRLRDELERARLGAKDERTKFVLESIRRDEQAMNLALAQYQRGNGNTVLHTWIQYAPDEDAQRLLEETSFNTDMEPDEVLARKLEIDRSLVELYRQLSDQCSAPSVNELFDRLAEQTSQRLTDQSWQARESETAPPTEQPRERRPRAGSSMPAKPKWERLR